MANELKFPQKVVFLNGNPITLPVRASDPVSGVEGDLYYNTTSDEVRVYDGSAWGSLSSGVVALTGQALNDGEIIVGNASNQSAAVDTDSVGDVLADHSTGLTLKDNSVVEAKIASGAVTDSKVASGISATKIADGSVSNTEFQYLDGVTSSIQTQLNAKIPSSEKGAANGVATLDAGGKVPVSQLPSSVMTYEGVWNASTNTPTLVDGTGDAGMVYRVGTAGSQNLGSGSISFEVGDYIIYNGSIWEKSDTTDAVASVNGFTGIVVLDSDDIAEGTSNLYFSDEKAQDAVGAMVDDSSKISLTYNDGTPSLIADIIAGSLVDADISASAAIAESKLALDYSTSSLNSAIGGKANDADVIKKDGSVAFTGNQSMGGNQLTDASSLKFVAPKVNRSQDGTNFIEEQYVDSVSLTASSTVTAYSYTAASYKGAHVEYVIFSAAGEVRTGKLYIANKSDGTNSMSDQYSETDETDIILSVDFSSPSIRLRAQNVAGSAGTMRLDVKLIRA
jgi:hypothetical protein